MQIEHITEGDNKKIVIHKSFYFSLGLMIFLTVSACILFFFVIQRYEGFANGWNKIMKAAQPIIIGLVVAYLLNPVMRFWERLFYKFFGKVIKKEKKARKLSRGLAIAGAILVLIVVIVLFIAAIAPSIGSSIALLIDILPAQVENLVKIIQNGDFGDSEFAEMFSEVLINVTNYVESWAQNDLLPLIQASLTSITSGVINIVKVIINFIIGLFVAVYVMSIQETLQGQGKKIIFAIFRPRIGNIIVHTIRKSSSIFGGFITGKIVDSAIIGCICYIGCVILQIPSVADSCCGNHRCDKCDSVFRTVHRCDSGIASRCDPEPVARAVSVDLYYCLTAGGRQHHRTEDIGKLHRIVLLLGNVRNSGLRRNMGLLRNALRCSDYGSYLLYCGQGGSIRA